MLSKNDLIIVNKTTKAFTILWFIKPVRMPRPK